MAPLPLTWLAVLGLVVTAYGASQAPAPGQEVPDDYQKFTDDYRKYLDYKQFMQQGGEKMPEFMDFMHSQSQASASSPAAVSLVADSSGDATDSSSASSSDSGAEQMGGASGMGGFDYSHFVPAGSMGGPQGGLAGATADFRKYMDYSKYMDISHQYTQTNWMNEWQKFQQDQQGGQQVPYSAKDCKTEEELDAWRKKQTGIAKQWIPKAYQGPTLDSIEQEYKTNLERIKNPQDVASDQAIADAAAQGPLLLPAAEPAAKPEASSVPLPNIPMARAARSVEELIAWRADMGVIVDQLPAKEKEEWNKLLSKEMEAGLARLQAAEAIPASPESLEAAPKVSRTRSRAVELSRTMLVFVVSFCVPVAAVYVYRGIKQAASPGTDYDAAFIALERGEDL